MQNLRNHDYYYQKLMLLIPQQNQQLDHSLLKTLTLISITSQNPKSLLFIQALMLGIILSYKSRTPTHYQY